jgi:hypothetical protein
MLAKVRVAAGIVLIVTVASCSVILTRDVHSVLRQGNATMGEVKRASTVLADYAELQTENLKSPATQKSIEHGLELGKVATLTVAKLNRTTIPRLNEGLDSLAGTVGSLDRLVQETNRRLNGESGLMVSATRLLDSMGEISGKLSLTIADVDTAVKMASEQTTKSADAIYALVSDPHIKAVFLNLDNATAAAAELVQYAAEAGKQMPSIAQSLEKIARTSSKFTKVTLLANVLSILARAFLP